MTTKCDSSAEFLYQLAQEFGYGAHAIFSPSGSKMWALCSGSLIPNLFADNENTYEAAEGTVAHWVGERWLKSGVRPNHLIGMVVPMYSDSELFLIEITHEMLDYVGDYAESCMETAKGCDLLLVEEHVTFGGLPPYIWHNGVRNAFPEQGGTIDCLIVKGHTLIIKDLKYGVGVPVNADHNYQLMLYAYGAWLRYGEKYGITEAVLCIAQVRLGPVQEFRISIKALLRKIEWFRNRMAIAWSVDAPRTPGPEQCRWCRVKADCPALMSFILDVVTGAYCGEAETMDDADMDVARAELAATYKKLKGNSSRLSTDEKVMVLMMQTVANEFFAAVKKSLEHKALSGEVPKGMKLVSGRSNRAFKDNRKAFETLLLYGLDEDDLIETTTVSPAQAETLLRNKLGLKREVVAAIIRKLATQPSGKPTLALASDRRKELESLDDSDIWD